MLGPARTRVALSAVLVLGILLRFTGLDWGLRHVPHVDERYFVENVQLMLSEGDFDHRFYEYPGLFFYLLYPVLALQERDGLPDTSPYLLARAVVAAFSVASVVLVYLLGTAIAGPRTGLVAASFLAVSPVEVQTAHMVRPDVVLEAFALLALLTFSAVGERKRQDLLSGAALGAATAVKFSGILLAPSYLLYRMLAPRPHLTRILLAGLAALIAFVVLSPYALVHLGEFIEGARTQVSYHYLDRPAGSASYLGMIWVYLGHPRGPLVKAFGVAGVFLVILGLVPIRREWRKWVPLLMFPVTTVAVFATAEVHHDRFLLPALGVLALMAGRAVDFLSQKHAPATLGLTLLAVAFPLVSSVSYVRDISKPSTRDRALDWIEANLSPGARILSTLPDLVPDGSCFELLKADESPKHFGLQSLHADIVLVRPEDQTETREGLELVLEIQPKNVHAGPPLLLYTVPDALRPRYETVPIDSSWLSASENGESVENLVDGLAATYWETEGSQGPGDWIQVDLPEPVLVGRVELSLGDRPLRYPRRLRLEGPVRDDQGHEAWRKIPHVPGRPGIRRQFTGNGGASQVLLLSPTPVRSLRVVQTGERTKPWAVAEIRLDALKRSP
jgi:hypothetical protein